MSTVNVIVTVETFYFLETKQPINFWVSKNGSELCNIKFPKDRAEFSSKNRLPLQNKEIFRLKKFASPW